MRRQIFITSCGISVLQLLAPAIGSAANPAGEARPLATRASKPSSDEETQKPAVAKPTIQRASVSKAIVAKTTKKTAAKLTLKPEGEDATKSHFGSDVPDNQPSARFKGHLPVIPRPADPRPRWLASDIEKNGIIIRPDKDVPWMSRSTFNPSAVVVGDELNLLFRAEDSTGQGLWHGTSRIGRARSKDGIHFTVQPKPVLEPTEWYESKGGTEDPRVTPKMPDGYHYMTYTGYRWEDKTARLAIARSKDLDHWEKLGLVLKDWKGFKDHPDWSKSGAIVPQKVNGEYIMYLLATSPASAHEQIYISRSKDMKTWKTDKRPVVRPREGFWDGILVEPGPTPFVDKQGNIHLLYNGDAPPNGYSAGEIVFSGKNPRQIISRSNTPLIGVTEAYEKEGQVGNVMFLEGESKYKGKRFFYYGAADDKIAAASANATDE